MPSLSFLHPALLFGLAAIGIPILIHLLFRRRFRRVDWAPMKYLKLSQKRNRRRIRLEQLLLLLLRCAAAALIFLAVARPVLHATGLGGWLARQGRGNQVIVIDDSLSMEFRDGSATAMTRAHEVADRLIDSMGSRDRLTLIAASRPNAPQLRDAPVDDRKQLAQLIRTIQPTSSHVAWSPTLSEVDRQIASGVSPVQEITILTDLRRPGWEEPLTELGARWAARGAAARVFDVGSQQSGNTALVSLSRRERVSLANAPLNYEAEIRNDSVQALPGANATLRLDGKPSSVGIPPIAAGASIRVSLPVRFATPGLHRVELQLADDALPKDNVRATICETRDQLRVVLVDGEPSSDPLESEVDFLALALAIGESDAQGWQIDVVDDSQWAGATLGDVDLVVLANVASLSAQQVDELERLTRGGAGCMLFLGDQVDLDNYNTALFRQGAGLAPAILEGVVEGNVRGLTLEKVSPSPLAALELLQSAALERIAVRKFMAVSLPPQGDDTRHVLARWNNAEGAPAAVSRTFGQGTCLLWTITADKSWTDWPIEPSFVLAMREAAAALVRGDTAMRTVTAGQPLARNLPVTSTVRDPRITLPGEETSRPARLEMNAGAPRIVFDDTRTAGIYQLDWTDPQGAVQQELWAVQPDARESDLARLEIDDLKQHFGTLEVDVISAGSESAQPTLAGREVWRGSAICLVAVLLFESALAAWTGRQR